MDATPLRRNLHTGERAHAWRRHAYANAYRRLGNQLLYQRQTFLDDLLEANGRVSN